MLIKIHYQVCGNLKRISLEIATLCDANTAMMSMIRALPGHPGQARYENTAQAFHLPVWLHRDTIPASRRTPTDK
jgi:hypothetical protein